MVVTNYVFTTVTNVVNNYIHESVTNVVNHHTTGMITNNIYTTVTNVVEHYYSTNTVVIVTNRVENFTTVTNHIENFSAVTNVVCIRVDGEGDGSRTGWGTSGGCTVSQEMSDFVPAAGFDGSKKRTFNGVVFDENGSLLGIAQITTAKETKKGVGVSGFVMFENGKKLAVKKTNGRILDGLLVVSATVAKTGVADLVVGADGFAGTLGSYRLVACSDTKDAGVLTGSLKMNTLSGSKLKSTKVTVGGVVSDGEAVGTATPKGGDANYFAAEVGK